MNYASLPTWFLTVLLCGFFSIPATRVEADEFSFDLDEIEKNPLSWGGYAEIKFEHMEIDQSSAFSMLNFADEPQSTIDRLTGSLQLDGNYSQDLYSFNWLLKMTGQEDDFGWNDTIDLFTAYLNIKPMPSATISLGKKPYKWGKGYAWNPVGFINRRKDPNNPEEALEGYIGAGLDLIKSFGGALQTVALTTVVLPVWQDINEDFGEANNVNFAAKLYLLYRDTDIDFLIFNGNSHSTRYGIDFSKNLATNFEVHGEFAYLTKIKQTYLSKTGTIIKRKRSVKKYLLGLRYLSESELTTIIEFYHNGNGFSETELDSFYQLVDDAENRFLSSGNNTLFKIAENISQKGYGSPQAGRNYLYLKINQKDPFDILYFTPGLIAILNLDDHSYSVTSEMLYTGFTNWELRLRFTFLNGGKFTEFKEKQNENKLEFRVRYHF